MSPELLEKFFFSGAGALISVCVAYVAVIKDLSFIKGQLTHIREDVKTISDIKEKQAIVQHELDSVKIDIKSSKDRIKTLYARGLT